MAHHPIVFNDTTNKNGIIQEIEFWTSLGDAGISGDAVLLKMFTARVNAAFDRIMPLLLSYGQYLKWDDLNQTDLPVGTFNIVSGQPDYTITQDDNGLDILNITNLSVLTSSTATTYTELEKLTIDNPLAIRAIAGDDSGVPTSYLERGNTIFLYPKPNYAATAGCKIFFEREAAYFDSTDTTKEAGIPRPFQGLLPLYAAYDWILVNKPGSTTLITRIEDQINKREAALRVAMASRYPTKTIMSMASPNHF